MENTTISQESINNILFQLQHQAIINSANLLYNDYMNNLRNLLISSSKLNEINLLYNSLFSNDDNAHDNFDNNCTNNNNEDDYNNDNNNEKNSEVPNDKQEKINFENEDGEKKKEKDEAKPVKEEDNDNDNDSNTNSNTNNNSNNSNNSNNNNYPISGEEKNIKTIRFLIEKNKKKDSKISLDIKNCHIKEVLVENKDKTEKRFICMHDNNNCGKQYRSKENLILHIKNKHEGEKPYFCKFCGKQYSHRSGKIKNKK
jgi:hypothetical protein